MTQAVDRLRVTRWLYESSNCVDTDRLLSPLFHAAISKCQTSHCPMSVANVSTVQPHKHVNNLHNRTTTDVKWWNYSITSNGLVVNYLFTNPCRIGWRKNARQNAHPFGQSLRNTTSVITTDRHTQTHIVPAWRHESKWKSFTSLYNTLTSHMDLKNARWVRPRFLSTKTKLSLSGTLFANQCLSRSS